MCRCDTDECCNLRAEYIDSRIGALVSEQADPQPGTWAHTVQVIKAMPIEELRRELAELRGQVNKGS
jgi:hypothetical protein